MLKIKDNVDLKELEKFGFEKIENDKKEIYSFKLDENGLDMECCILVNDIDNVDRALRFMYYNSCDFEDDEEEWINYDCLIPNVIYDLIQVGIVEKI